MTKHTSVAEWRRLIAQALAEEPTITMENLVTAISKDLPDKAPGTIKVRVYAMTKTNEQGNLVLDDSGPPFVPEVRQDTAPPENSQEIKEEAVEAKPVAPLMLAPASGAMAPYPENAILYDGDVVGLIGTRWFPRADVTSSGKTTPWQVNFPDGTIWQIEIPTAKAFSSYVPRGLMGKNTDVSVIQKLLDIGHPFLVIGHTGVGKTTAIVAAAGDKTWRWNVSAKKPWEYSRVYRAVMSNMDYEQLIGQYVPREGKFVWQDGVLTKMVRYGGIFIADEVNFTVPSVLAAMNSLLDNDRTLNIFDHDGEVIHAHKDFRFCATMNPPGYGYMGVKSLNDAFKSRFTHILWYGWDSKIEKEVFSPDAEYDGIPMKQIHSFFHDLRGLFPIQLKYPPGMRDIEHFVENTKTVGFEQAIISLLLMYNSLEEKQMVLSSVKTNFSSERVMSLLTSSAESKYS